MSAIGVITCAVLGLLLYAMLAGAALALVKIDNGYRECVALFAPLVLAAIGGRAIVEWLREWHRGPAIPKMQALTPEQAKRAASWVADVEAGREPRKCDARIE